MAINIGPEGKRPNKKKENNFKLLILNWPFI